MNRMSAFFNPSYAILSAVTLIDLSASVNELMAVESVGFQWRPTGGVCVVPYPDTDSVMFYQAIERVKK